MARKTKAHKPPSRIRYDQQHPVVSFRVPKELYDRLEAVKKTEGKSTTDVLKIGVGLLIAKIRAEAAIKQEGYDQGYDKAAQGAHELFAVTYRCSVCGKIIEIESDEAKKAAGEYMTEHGWGHTDCVEGKD